ncbi:MAG: NADP-dependent oxidoreductase, partial [Bacteroidota bacterium]
EVRAGQMLVKQHYISLDPAMRGWMNDMKSYIPPVQLGEVMRAGSVGEVVASSLEKFPVGSFVSGWGGVQQYHLSDGSNYHVVDPSIAPLPLYIGTLGMPGMTAYFGILQEGKIKAGDVVLVSGAAGAVGSLVGQIAKLKGCKVVGIAGGIAKCTYLKDTLGFDDAIDYKNESVYQEIQRACPDGVDVYFDNVGGDILDAALANLRFGARVVICGAISQYNNRDNVQGPKNYLSLLVNRATMKGMVVLDYATDYQQAAKEMGMWLAQGRLKSKEDIYDGIEHFPATFRRLFTGEKLGKLVLKVIED